MVSIHHALDAAPAGLRFPAWFCLQTKAVRHDRMGEVKIRLQISIFCTQLGRFVSHCLVVVRLNCGALSPAKQGGVTSAALA
jgi:hypothetical protein